MEVEKIPLLSRLHQAQRNVDEARAVDSQSFMVDIVKNYDVDSADSMKPNKKDVWGRWNSPYIVVLLCLFALSVTLMILKGHKERPL